MQSWFISSLGLSSNHVSSHRLVWNARAGLLRKLKYCFSDFLSCHTILHLHFEAKTMHHLCDILCTPLPYYSLFSHATTLFFAILLCSSVQTALWASIFGRLDKLLKSCWQNMRWTLNTLWQNSDFWPQKSKLWNSHLEFLIWVLLSSFLARKFRLNFFGIKIEFCLSVYGKAGHQTCKIKEQNLEVQLRISFSFKAAYQRGNEICGEKFR